MRNAVVALPVALFLLAACGSAEDGKSHPVGSAGGTASSGGSIAAGGSAVSAGGTTGGSLASGGSETAGGSQTAGGTGAVGASGGSGGTEVGPDPTILACDDIEPGSGWQHITPPGDIGGSQAIALDPFEVGTIYTQMHKGGNGAHFETDGIYKSTDCGSTWNKLPPGRNARDNTEGEVNIHSGSIVSIIVDPVEPGVMYIASNYGPPGIYKSTNGGVDWDQMIPENLEPYLEYGGWFNALSVDPTDRLHLVGATHTGCEGAFAPNCLAETRDGGDTWRLIPAPASGSEQCGAYIHSATTMMYVCGQDGASVTTNDSADNDTPTWTKVAQGANGADTGLLAYQAGNGKYYLGTDYGVLEGSEDFVTWTLDEAAPHQVPFIVGSGENMFASTRSPAYYTAKEESPAAWSELDAGGDAPTTDSGRWLLYESTHQILYVLSWGDGLYRIATP